ncbi:MAG: hypothetical protein D8M53_09795 [Armatimonadetes bacterium]|nr:hypothetical protein [Armatimonadota bacterium]
MIIRPDAVLLDSGEIVPGVEVCILEGTIDRIRPWTKAAREENGLLLSCAFVNAHSHLEYYDLIGQVEADDYWAWIQEIVRLKPLRPMHQVAEAAELAAHTNRATGVSAIGEHSDWPVSGDAIRNAGLGGRIFQEVITMREWADPEEKVARVAEAATINAKSSGLPVHLAPHTPFTVHPDALRAIFQSGSPTSIHVAESRYEREFFERGEGPIAGLYRQLGVPIEPPGISPVAYIAALGGLTESTQLVHVCDLHEEDVWRIGSARCKIAHCPRSNVALGCPPAPIRELQSAGATVGLGMDSAASSGPIDMFAEMRAAVHVAEGRGDVLGAESVWRMATTDAAISIFSERRWEMIEGGQPDLMLMDTGRWTRLPEIIANCAPRSVMRVINVAKREEPASQPAP